ncbi:MAG: site-2 protease family protein [Planctomycetota bacterium]
MDLGIDTGILQVVMLVVLMILCLSVHEAAHAWAALKCGDTTGRDEGRLTLNPIPHIDPIFTIVVPAMLLLLTNGAFAFGGAKPVPVNFYRLRHPWRDMSLVALAGPGSNLLLSILFLVLYKFFVQTGWYNGAADDLWARKRDLLPLVLRGAAHFNLVLTFFNLIPIPPLDGSRVMAWLLPDSMRSAYLAIERFGIVIVAFLLYGNTGFSRMLSSTINAVYFWMYDLLPFGRA